MMSSVEMNPLSYPVIEVELGPFALSDSNICDSPLITSICSQRFTTAHFGESSISDLGKRGLSISVSGSPLIRQSSPVNQEISPLSLDSVDLSDEKLFNEARQIQSINVQEEANHHPVRFFIGVVGLVVMAVMAFFLCKALSKR